MTIVAYSDADRRDASPQLQGQLLERDRTGLRSGSAPRLSRPQLGVTGTAAVGVPVHRSAVVTMMLTDIAGSTEMLTRLGDAAAEWVFRVVDKVVRDCASSHGGHVVKELGDGHMVAFAAPRDAIACAVAIQRELHSEGPGGDIPELRIGINAGEVETTTDDLRGQAVHATARITARAQAGEILVSDVVRQLAGCVPDVHWIDRGRVRLRGFPQRWLLHGVDWRVLPLCVPTPRAEVVALEATASALGCMSGRGYTGNTDAESPYLAWIGLLEQLAERLLAEVAVIYEAMPRTGGCAGAGRVTTNNGVISQSV